MSFGEREQISRAKLDSLLSPDLLAFWDFQEEPGTPRTSLLGRPYTLNEGSEPIQRVTGGVFGNYCANLRRGDYFRSKRRDCAALDINGLKSSLSVIAWIKRQRKFEVQCEAIAGMWDETRSRRQYGLFLDLRIHSGSDNVCGHVSSSGGPTPGFPWCMDASIGAGYVTYDQWHCVAFTFDGTLVRSWLNGKLQVRPGFNPYAYPHGLLAAGSDGADFTVGAVSRGGEMGNWFVGQIGGLAVYSTALDEEDMVRMTALLPTAPLDSPTSPPVLV